MYLCRISVYNLLHVSSFLNFFSFDVYPVLVQMYCTIHGEKNAFDLVASLHQIIVDTFSVITPWLQINPDGFILLCTSHLAYL